MSTAQKSESPAVTGLIADERTESRASVTPAPDHRKKVATLIAAMALSGHEVHELTAGGFMVVRWGTTRHCPDVAALECFARQIGAIR
jgi:hypothetical protein